MHTEGAPYAVRRFSHGKGQACVEMSRVTLPNRAYPLHIHQAFSMALVIREPQLFQVRTGLQEAPIGSVMFANPWEPHRNVAQGPGGVAFFSVQFGSEALGFRSWGREPYFSQAVVLDPELARRMLALFDVLDRPDRTSQRDARFSDILDYLHLRQYLKWRGSRAKSGSNCLGRSLALIQNHDHRILSLAELAAHVDRNPAYLCRAFRKHLGMAPHQLQTSGKVSKARALLLQGRKPAEVAYDLDFSDQSHLIRCFKRVFGITPGQFQKSVNFVQYA